MPHPASRLITLIFLLQRRPNQKVGDLAHSLGVSVRTVHRYFAALDEMGIPVTSERGPNGGFSLVQGYKMPPLIFSPEEAAAVYLGTGLVEELWGSLYREPARGVLAKLDNILPGEQRQEVAWARRSLVATGLNRSDLDKLAKVLEVLRGAVRDTRRVRLDYRSVSRSETHSREIDPYAMVHRWGWWYVIGYCHLRKEVRSFRVDRMEQVLLTSEKFQVPDDFNIPDYLAHEMQSQPQQRVKMRFVPMAVQAAWNNRSNWETLEEKPDGSLVVTFMTPDLNWAASAVLAYGPAVIVLEPAELRTQVVDWAQSVVEMYRLEKEMVQNRGE